MTDQQLIADLLSALEYHTEQTRPIEFSRVAIEAAREYLRKLAQPEQEPYCYTYTENGEEYFAPPKAYVPDDATPLYTSPPAQRTWVGMTDEEIEKIWDSGVRAFPLLARAIEARLKEKNT